MAGPSRRTYPPGSPEEAFLISIGEDPRREREPPQRTYPPGSPEEAFLISIGDLPRREREPPVVEPAVGEALDIRDRLRAQAATEAEKALYGATGATGQDLPPAALSGSVRKAIEEAGRRGLVPEQLTPAAAAENWGRLAEEQPETFGRVGQEAEEILGTPSWGGRIRSFLGSVPVTVAAFGPGKGRGPGLSTLVEDVTGVSREPEGAMGLGRAVPPGGRTVHRPTLVSSFLDVLGTPQRVFITAPVEKLTGDRPGEGLWERLGAAAKFPSWSHGSPRDNVMMTRRTLAELGHDPNSWWGIGVQLAAGMADPAMLLGGQRLPKVMQAVRQATKAARVGLEATGSRGAILRGQVAAFARQAEDVIRTEGSIAKARPVLRAMIDDQVGAEGVAVFDRFGVDLGEQGTLVGLPGLRGREGVGPLGWNPEVVSAPAWRSLGEAAGGVAGAVASRVPGASRVSEILAAGRRALDPSAKPPVGTMPAEDWKDFYERRMLAMAEPEHERAVVAGGLERISRMYRARGRKTKDPAMMSTADLAAWSSDPRKVATAEREASLAVLNWPMRRATERWGPNRAAEKIGVVGDGTLVPDPSLTGGPLDFEDPVSAAIRRAYSSAVVTGRNEWYIAGRQMPDLGLVGDVFGRRLHGILVDLGWAQDASDAIVADVWPRVKVALADDVPAYVKVMEGLDSRIYNLTSLHQTTEARLRAKERAIAAPHAKRMANKAAAEAREKVRASFVPQADPIAGIRQPGLLYHGTKKSFDSLTGFEPYGHSSLRSIFGFGLYLTDDPDIAAGYARTKGAGPSGRIYAAQVAPTARLIDLEKPMPRDAMDVFLRAAPETKTTQGMSGREFIQAFRSELADQEMLASEAMDIMSEANDSLLELGYDGFTHVGGLKGGKAHNVTILFDPNGLSGDRPVLTETGMADISQKSLAEAMRLKEDAAASEASNAANEAVMAKVGGDLDNHFVHIIRNREAILRRHPVAPPPGAARMGAPRDHVDVLENYEHGQDPVTDILVTTAARVEAHARWRGQMEAADLVISDRRWAVPEREARGLRTQDGWQGFIHPLTDEPYRVRAEVAKDFARIVEGYKPGGIDVLFRAVAEAVPWLGTPMSGWKARATHGRPLAYNLRNIPDDLWRMWMGGWDGSAATAKEAFKVALMGRLEEGGAQSLRPSVIAARRRGELTTDRLGAAFDSKLAEMADRPDSVITQKGTGAKVTLRQAYREAAKRGMMEKGFAGAELSTPAAVHGMRGRRFSPFDLGLKELNPLHREHALFGEGGFYLRTTGSLSRAAENHRRLTTFIAAWKRGETWDEAAHNVRKWLFDYHEVTDELRRWLRPTIPFVTFTMKAIPAHWRAMRQHPGRYLAVARAGQVSAEVAESSLGPVAVLEPWIDDQMSVRIPRRSSMGSDQFINFGLSWSEMNALNPLLMQTPADRASFFEDVSPVVDLATIMMTGRDHRTGRVLRNEWSEPDVSLLALIEGWNGTPGLNSAFKVPIKEDRTPDGRVRRMVPAEMAWAYDKWLPHVVAVTRASAEPKDPFARERRPGAILRQLTGISVITNNPIKAESDALRRMLDVVQPSTRNVEVGNQAGGAAR